MNDNELDRCVAASFHVPDAGSDGLSARLQALQAGAGSRVRSRTERVSGVLFARRLVVGLAVTSILVFALLTYPRINRPVSAAAAVRKALAGVNTWHLKGWKIQSGRKVAWEVWGRRNPFFYREQIGANVVVDDGAQRLSIYGPSTDANLLKGVCLRLPSLQGAENVPWSYDQMVLQWRSAGKPWKQTPQGPVFNFNASGMDGYHINTDNLYSIDGSTSLPTRYEKRTYNIDHEKSYRTVALLAADYNDPVPASASAAIVPGGYREYDARVSPEGLPTQGDGAAAANGLTVQCQPIATDKEGNILIKMRGWLGNATIGPEQGEVHFQASTKVQVNTAPLDPCINHDDQGRAYVAVRWFPLIWGNPDRNTILMLFVPREPLAVGAALPRTLTAMFDSVVFAGYGAPDNTFLRQDMSVTALLPKAGVAISKAIAPYSGTDGRPRANQAINYGGFDNLETAIYLARAQDYGSHSDTTTPNTLAFRRHIDWSERAIASANSLDIQIWREDLARNYLALGDNAHARRILRDMVNEKRYLKLQCLPYDRSPEGYRQANAQLSKWNQQYYREARTMLSALDKVQKSH